MQIFKVSEFINFLNEALLAIAPRDEVAIEGEVSNFNIAQNQWVRFDLKDETSLLNCFLTIWQLNTPLEDGMKIRVYGFPKVYPRYGKLSLVVQRIDLIGEGALKKAFELLKKKLAAEGLFEVSRKRPLPRFPSRIALITSPGAAAYTDFLRIINNRWRGLTIDLLPVAVQGISAVSQIANAFRRVNAHSDDYDVCVLTRGGGSLEDLQAFNSEAVARAIYACRVPVICGVGHERDETLADYAADVRAATPSNAAELLVPDYRAIQRDIEKMGQEMMVNYHRQIASYNERVTSAVWRLESFITDKTHACRSLFKILSQRLVLFSQRVKRYGQETADFSENLPVIFKHHLQKYFSKIEQEERVLRGLDPRAVLKRGYSIVFSADGQRVIKSSAQVDKGEMIKIKLKEGSLESEVINRHYG